MKWFVKIVVVALLTLWVPATIHCMLKTVPGLELLVCSPHADTAPHEDSDCDASGCAVLEMGLYQLEPNPRTSAPPTLILLTTGLLPATLEPLPPSILSAPSGAPPPGLDRTWQFFFRAALSPRAPSGLS